MLVKTCGLIVNSLLYPVFLRISIDIDFTMCYNSVTLRAVDGFVCEFGARACACPMTGDIAYD